MIAYQNLIGLIILPQDLELYLPIRKLNEITINPIRQYIPGIPALISNRTNKGSLDAVIMQLK